MSTFYNNMLPKIFGDSLVQNHNNSKYTHSISYKWLQHCLPVHFSVISVKTKNKSIVGQHTAHRDGLTGMGRAGQVVRHQRKSQLLRALKTWSDYITYWFRMNSLGLSLYNVLKTKTSPKGFLVSKCNLGNWIFSKSLEFFWNFWEIFWEFLLEFFWNSLRILSELIGNYLGIL